MKLSIPRHNPGPVEFWLRDALTEFINGFIDGLGTGTVLGAGVGVGTTSAGLWVGLPWFLQLLVPVGTMISTGFSRGFHSVITWHKTNRFPSFWAPIPHNENLSPTPNPSSGIPAGN